jgi:hypothetical protein
VQPDVRREGLAIQFLSHVSFGVLLELGVSSIYIFSIPFLSHALLST